MHSQAQTQTQALYQLLLTILSGGVWCTIPLTVIKHGNNERDVDEIVFKNIFVTHVSKRIIDYSHTPMRAHTRARKHTTDTLLQWVAVSDGLFHTVICCDQVRR